MRLKDYCPDNRPLERLLKYGAEALSTAELLAIIIKTGTKGNNVLSISNKILSKYSLNNLSRTTIKELEQIKGIGKTKAAQIKAIFEISKRIECYNLNINNKNYIKVFNPIDVYNYLKEDYYNCNNEKLIVVCLNVRNELFSKKTLTMGTEHETLFSTKEVLDYAIRQRAKGIIISHNHPSGILIPSAQDIKMTNELKKACDLLEIEFVDHIIVANNDYFSFKEKKIIKF